MLRFLFSLALAAAGQHNTAQVADDPRSIVRAATRAIQGDSAARLEARWRDRVSRRPGDRAAMLGLATLARLRYDYPSSERMYRALIAGASDGYAVYAHLGLVDGDETRGMARDALVELDRGLAMSRQIGDRIAEADALLTSAFARGRVAGVRVAAAYVDTAVGLIPDTAFDLRSRTLNRRAIIHAMNGRTVPASAAADSAVSFARRSADRRLEADAYRIVGQVLQYRSQFDSAFVALRRSESLYLGAHNRSALARSLIWHAQVLGGRGRYGEMRDAARRALSYGEETHNPAAIGDAHRMLGVLAQMLGDWPAASAHIRRALAVSIANGDSSGAMTSRKFLADVALAAGDVATAKRLALERLDWAHRTDDVNALYEVYRLLANIAERERDTPTVIRSLDSARAQLPRLPGYDYPRWLLHDEARHAFARGDLSAAERSLDAYLKLAKGGTCHVCVFDSRLRLADLYARRGELARAEQELVNATDDIDRFRAALSDADLRTLAFQSAATMDASASEPGSSAIQVARILAALANGRRVDVAFALAERWRARELTERLARAAALRADPSAVGRPMSSAPARTVSEVAASLPDETALIEFVAAEGTPITAFVVQQDGVRARVLPPIDSLAGAVARLTSLLESGADAARLGRTLGAGLLDSVLPLLGARVKRLVIVPDGALHRLPFDALRLTDGRYLFERYAVGIAPSASAMVALRARRGRNEQAQSLRLLAIGDPAISTKSRNTSRDGDSDDDLATIASVSGAPKLVGASREARLVARYAPSADVRLGREATAAFLRHADLRKYRVLHLATHALVDEQSLARTALALTPSDGENGLVGPGDLAALSLDADLVVLSACRSAGGVLVGGEGVQGLTSPLLQAGARSVVATSWRISDQRVVPFIEQFYDGLARGLPVVDALRAAKLSALKGGEPPRIWAAFLAIGDPAITVPLRAPPKGWWARLTP